MVMLCCAVWCCWQVRVMNALGTVRTVIQPGDLLGVEQLQRKDAPEVRLLLLLLLLAAANAAATATGVAATAAAAAAAAAATAAAAVAAVVCCLTLPNLNANAVQCLHLHLVGYREPYSPPPSFARRC